MIDIRKLELSEEVTKIEIVSDLTRYKNGWYKSPTVSLNIPNRGIYNVSLAISESDGSALTRRHVYPYALIDGRAVCHKTAFLDMTAGENEVTFYSKRVRIWNDDVLNSVNITLTLTRYNEMPVSLSGNFETDVNTLPKLEEQYYNFGISDAYIKLDTARENKIAKDMDRDTPHAIYADGKLLTVMYFEDIEEIVNNTVKELYLTDNSDDIYTAPLSGDILGSQTLFRLLERRKESIGKPKVYDMVSFERLANMELEEFYFEDTSSREFIAWIQELADVTVGICEGNFGVFEY